MGFSNVRNQADGTEEYSVVVIGAGMGGIYALHRFADLGHDVHGFEGADGVGGVWYAGGHGKDPRTAWSKSSSRKDVKK